MMTSIPRRTISNSNLYFLLFTLRTNDATTLTAKLELLERSGSSLLRCNDAPTRRADVGTMQCWYRAPNSNLYTFILIPNITYSCTLDLANYFIIFTHSYTNLMTLLFFLFSKSLSYTHTYTIQLRLLMHTYFNTFITLQKCARLRLPHL